MEFHSVRRTFHPNHLGEEKQQMLDLNRRLETYLSRVKLLEEENELLANEIKALRYNHQGAQRRREGLLEELQQARLDVEAAWRERVLTELEVEKLNEELQDLELQRQREAQAKVMVKTKMEQSRRELEEEERAQIWLREKVSQLKHEMKHLIQTHEDDVAHMEAKLTQSRSTAPPLMAQRSNHTPDLLRMGQEFSEKANRAWQEASEAYQGQIAQLEESLHQTQSHLSQVCQEKQASQLKLQALEKEISSAQDVRMHLEKAVAQCRGEHHQEIQQIQEHLECLEMEKEELALQINHLIQENRGLMQTKMSLGLEVATYRALLDCESLGADALLSNKPRSASIRDAALSSRGVKRNYQSQMSASLKTVFPPSVFGVMGPTATETQLRSQKPAIFNQTQEISSRSDKDAAKLAALESPCLKIVQNEAADRPREVHEKVAYAEPSLPLNEEEGSAKSLEDEQKEVWNIVDPVESVVCQKVESIFSSGPPSDDGADLHDFTTPSLISGNFQEKEEPHQVTEEEETVLDLEKEEEDEQRLQVQTDAGDTQQAGKDVDDVQGETSDSETEAMLEPTVESRPSSVESAECDENISNEEVAVMREEPSTSMETYTEEAEDKLYPDGEEMDTWDSVIERKVEVKIQDDVKNEDQNQHAEPEEDISAKEPEEEVREAHHNESMAPSMMIMRAEDEQVTMLDQELAPPAEKEEEHDEEDSQNVSVSWRTELEGDSYAQENTLADTRPLIRYKSDDTDANTLASHVDESESSEGEQERKMEEVGIGAWSDGKSKAFGTMEDLCEEVEEETMDEEYNLGYTHAEDRDISQGSIVSEDVSLLNEEKLKNTGEEPSGKETEDVERSNVDLGEEQELEMWPAHIFSADLVQQQVRDKLLKTDNDSVEVNEPVEAERASDSSSSELGISLNCEHALKEDQASDKQLFRDPNADMNQTNSVEEDQVQVQNEAQETLNESKNGEEDEDNRSMVPHADVDLSSPTDFKDLIETQNPQDPNFVFLVPAEDKSQEDLTASPEIPEQTFSKSQEHVSEDFHMLPDPPETADWEVLENPKQQFDIRDQNQDDDDMLESADDDVINPEEPAEMSPDDAPDENDIFIVKDATGKLFPSEVKKDFWVSSLESGASYEPEDSHMEASEQSNKNQGFTDNQVSESLENSAVVNGNSEFDAEASKAKAAVKEQEQKNVLFYSEESEGEAESWSSGEEEECREELDQSLDAKHIC
nr:nestin [Nothobranchius furzeri]